MMSDSRSLRLLLVVVVVLLTACGGGDGGADTLDEAIDWRIDFLERTASESSDDIEIVGTSVRIQPCNLVEEWNAAVSVYMRIPDSTMFELRDALSEDLTDVESLPDGGVFGHFEGEGVLASLLAQPEGTVQAVSGTGCYGHSQTSTGDAFDLKTDPPFEVEFYDSDE